jgi:hypothetical protein
VAPLPPNPASAEPLGDPWLPQQPQPNMRLTLDEASSSAQKFDPPKKVRQPIAVLFDRVI